MTLPAGTHLGTYEITGSLGAGGMGEVYRATDTNLKREVAIKILPPAFASDADRIARFQREAESLAALNHPNIAQIYGLERSGETTALAMELVEGPTLADRIAEGPVPPDDALTIAAQIADALQAAHEQNIVHRDLKPANIKLRPDGTVKVLDFGIATAPESPVATSGRRSPVLLTPALTEAGVLLGTAAYMSPEQARGRAVDQRADIWAFGCVLYEMLTGQPAFGGEDVTTTLARVLEREANAAALPAALPVAVRHTIELCLEKDPNERLADIRDVRLALAGRFEAIDNASGGGEAASPAWRRALPVAAAVLLTAAVATAVAWTLRSKPAPPSIVRFAYSIGQDQFFRNPGRSVIALSPDGQRFVYNVSDGLYIRAMNQLEARRIPGTEESLNNPFFSADGQSVAYWAVAGGALKRVALSGGAPIVIASGVANLNGASWTPNGNILFGQPDGIYRVSANGGTPELVIRAQEGEQLYGPELLPDGDSVLFSATTTGLWDEAQIAVQSLSTGKRTGLISGGSDAHYVPTGHLVYALGDGLFAIAFDAATLALSGGPVSLVQGVSRGVISASANYGIANDGTLVYVSGVGAAGPLGQNKAEWVGRDGKEEPLGLSCTCASPAVSPDGTRLAFDSPTTDLKDADIWIWSLAQRTNTRLTFEPGYQLGAVWSPDSTRIAYETLGEGLYVRPADGTGMPERLLTASNTVIAWSWLPDDKLIISEDTGSSGYDIALLDLAGDHERRPLLATKFNEYRPAASPDGHWLAYQSDESGQYEIYVRPLPNVDAGKWQVSSGGGEEPKWSRDGHTLAYLGPTSLMVTAVGDGTVFVHDTPKAVLDRKPYAYAGLPPRSYDISPDGQRFLLTKLAGTEGADAAPPQIIVVTNWLEELKARVPTK